jgi:ectoine hydroxylase-related dioxygenase (phytanoyl-CoA dioxygenase family)
VLVDGLFPAALTARAAVEIEWQLGKSDDGQAFEFPSSPCPSLNTLTLHPRVIRASRQLLGLPGDDELTSLRLTLSKLLTRVGPAATAQSGPEDLFINIYGQRMHTDFPDFTLLAPPPFSEAPEMVQCLLYFDEVEEMGGTTAVVPCEGLDDPAYAAPGPGQPFPVAGAPPFPWTNDRQGTERRFAEAEDHPEIVAFRERLYAREVRVHYQPGTALLMRMDTWHRGTRNKPGAKRRTMQLGYRRADAEWTSQVGGWALELLRDPEWAFSSLMANASVEQRGVLGWPKPGHRYWTEATITGVVRRYGSFGFDERPYRAAL